MAMGGRKCKPNILSLNLQQQLARGLPSLQVCVCTRHLLKGIDLMDLDLDLLGLDQLKQLGCPPLPLLRGNNVPKENRPHHLDVLGTQPQDIQGIDLARRIAKANNQAFPRDDIQIRIERSLAHAVKDHIHAPAVGDLLDPLHHVLALAIDRPLRAMAPRLLALLLSTRRSDDLGAHNAQDLHQQRARAARGSVHQRPGSLADAQLLLDARGLAHERERCETLQQGGGGGFGGDALGKRPHGARGGHGRVLRVAGVGEVDDAVARGEARVLGGYDRAGGFFAGY